MVLLSLIVKTMSQFCEVEIELESKSFKDDAFGLSKAR